MPSNVGPAAWNVRRHCHRNVGRCLRNKRFPPAELTREAPTVKSLLADDCPLPSNHYRLPTIVLYLASVNGSRANVDRPNTNRTPNRKTPDPEGSAKTCRRLFLLEPRGISGNCTCCGASWSWADGYAHAGACAAPCAAGGLSGRSGPPGPFDEANIQRSAHLQRRGTGFD